MFFFFLRIRIQESKSKNPRIQESRIQESKNPSRLPESRIQNWESKILAYRSPESKSKNPKFSLTRVQNPNRPESNLHATSQTPVGSSNISLQRDFLCKMLICNRFENSKYRIMKQMHTILIFIYCSKNTFLRVLDPRLQIEIFDFPDNFFSNARTLTVADMFLGTHIIAESWDMSPT